jgi:hypothetical protein
MSNTILYLLVVISTQFSPLFDITGAVKDIEYRNKTM